MNLLYLLTRPHIRILSKMQGIPKSNPGWSTAKTL